MTCRWCRRPLDAVRSESGWHGYTMLVVPGEDHDNCPSSPEGLHEAR